MIIWNIFIAHFSPCNIFPMCLNNCILFGVMLSKCQYFIQTLSLHYIHSLFWIQVHMIFLQWIPWLLRMSRPGEKITRKSILMQKKIKELDKTEVKQDKVDMERTQLCFLHWFMQVSSKTLLANVLDMDDDFCTVSSTVVTSSVSLNGEKEQKLPGFWVHCIQRF